MTPLLELRDLKVTLDTHRGRADALRGLTVSIGRGETVGLIGESGCGKSMTALAIMRLLPERASISGSMRLAASAPAGGTANGVESIDLATLDEPSMCRIRGRRIGVIFQEPMTALNPVHTVGDQIAEPMRLHLGLSKREARGEALRLLEQVHLPQPRERLDAYPHQLSGGQRQRVGIAIALACGPDLLIADEPTTALDVTIQREILDLLAELTAERGMAMLLISHDLAMMARSVQTVHVMYGGSIVESGPTARVFEHLAHPYTRGLFAARPRVGVSRGTRLATIPGRVPELADLPPGCPFADRCGYTIDRCREGLPEVTAVAGEHTVRCVRAGEWAAESVAPDAPDAP